MTGCDPKGLKIRFSFHLNFNLAPSSGQLNTFSLVYEPVLEV